MRSEKMIFIVALAFLSACNLPVGGAGQPPAEILPSPTEPLPASALPATTEPPAFSPEVPAETAVFEVIHSMQPAELAPSGKLIYDVESVSTAPEKRAPYGDSYHINRLERPFLKDMTYIPDLDISAFSVHQDGEWYYVSIDLIGNDPNNEMGIHYGVELDKDHDGFGDYIIWASPPYSKQWDAANVKIFSDTNRDTAGLSAGRSDAPIPGDGYDSLVFNGGLGDSDPDLAWVRMGAGGNATVQFAFKRSWAGAEFMLGVIADSGLKDVAKLDYVDRFIEKEAGSPVKDKKQYYPLGELFAVDNTCQEAFGFKPSGNEWKLCPRESAPRKTPQAGEQPGEIPQIPCSQYSSAASCRAAGCTWVTGGITAVFAYCQ